MGGGQDLNLLKYDVLIVDQMLPTLRTKVAGLPGSSSSRKPPIPKHCVSSQNPRLPIISDFASILN